MVVACEEAVRECHDDLTYIPRELRLMGPDVAGRRVLVPFHVVLVVSVVPTRAAVTEAIQLHPVVITG